MTQTHPAPGDDVTGAPHPRIIGYAADGRPIHLGGGGAPMDMIVDDNDDDDDTGDDAFDGDGNDGDEDDDRPRGRKPRDTGRDTRRAVNRRARRDEADDDEDDEPDDDEADDEQDDRAADDWKPPTRAQVEKMEAALQKANREAAQRRRIGKTMDKIGIKDADEFNDWLLSRGIDPESGQRLLGDDEDPDEEFGQPDDNGQRRGRTREEVARDLKRAEQRGRAAAEETWRPGVALFAADASLRAAGFNGNDRMLTRALRLLDPDSFDITIDEDTGWPVVGGLEDQVEALKEDYPEWFRPARPSRGQRDEDEYGDSSGRRSTSARRPARGAREVDGGERRRSAAPKRQTWLQQLNARMEGRR
jgi:hypothetical protein